MKSTFFALAAMGAAGSASAAVSAYGQCGGQGFSGDSTCVSGYTCQKQNDWYSQCIAGAAANTLSKAASTKVAASSSSCAVKYVTKPLSEKPAATTQAASKPASTQAASKPAATQVAASKPASSAAAAPTKAAASSSAAAVKPAAAAVTTASKAAGSGVQYGGVNVCFIPESSESIDQPTNTSHRSPVSTSAAVPMVLATVAPALPPTRTASTR
jgi:endoglucanase